MILSKDDKLLIQVMCGMDYKYIYRTYGKDFAEWFYKEIYEFNRDKYCSEKYGVTFQSLH